MVHSLSAVEVSAEQTSPLSESQNRLLGNDYHSEEDHKETEILKSGAFHISLCSSWCYVKNVENNHDIVFQMKVRPSLSLLRVSHSQVS